MSDEVKTEEKKENSLKIVETVAPMGVIGHPKLGGKKKGYRSARFVLRDMLQEINVEPDSSKRTVLQALFDTQIEIVKKKGDRDTLKFILEQAADLITPQQSATDNYFNIDSIKHITNNNAFLALEGGEEEDPIEEEVIEVRDMKLE